MIKPISIKKIKASKRTWHVITGLAMLSILLHARFMSTPILETKSYSVKIQDQNQQLLRLTLSGDEKYRIFTPLAEINPQFVEAALLHEDRHFFYHLGVNPIALLKAGINTYARGTRRMGGSTITMQLARMLYPFHSISLSGKVKQIILALQLEALHSKHEILEAYLNLLPYGGNIEGVGAASLIYFSKSATNLTLAESLNLAVIPQNPNFRLLSSGNSTEKASNLISSARMRLFQTWVSLHPHETSETQELELPIVNKGLSQLPFRAPHFVELARQLRPTQKLLNTSLNYSIQNLAERKLKAYVEGHKNLGITNASVMILNFETMQVNAMIGSADFFNNDIEGQVNGTLAKRSPGSTLKPFVYGLAIDQGLIHPLTLLKDTPMSFNGFDPENFDRNFSGPVNARDALIRSRNVPAVYLTSLLSKPTLYEFLKSSQVKQLKSPEFYGLSLSLGGAELRMDELVRLYASLANGGKLKPLRYFQDDKIEEGKSILSPEASFLTLDMLKNNPRPDQKFSNQWVRNSVPVAWKTGTSHGFRDAWSIGVMGPFVIAVWLGNFGGQGNPALIGRDMAGPLFFSLVDALKEHATGQEHWLSPEGLNLKRLKVCSLSGHLPTKHCSHQIETWFIAGKSPITQCSIHREILISKKSGLRACEDAPNVKSDVFEFWPSDLLHIFRIAGIPRRPPPRFEASCSTQETQNFGVAPNITSPKKDVTYTLRLPAAELAEESPIPLQAVVDGDAQKLTWFVGNELIGQSDPQKPLLWKPRPGRFTVRVVDNLGRSDSRSLDVKMSQ